MSHRNDLFAAQALRGLLESKARGSDYTVTTDDSMTWYCTKAYAYADKMEELRPIVASAGSGAITTTLP